MDEDKAEQQSNRGATLDVFPLSKGKRMLLFLGDFFLVFILALFLSNIVVYPIAKSATDYDTKESLNVANQQGRYTILYENHLLFNESAETKNSLEDNLEYTYSRFLSYYVVGASIENEIYHNYYSQYHNQDGKSLLKLYKAYDLSEFFDFGTINGEGLPALKEKYQVEFAPKYEEGNEMSETGQINYNYLFEHFFLSMYYTMIDDIKFNDLHLPNNELSASYNDLTEKIEEFNDFYDSTAIICSSISFGAAAVALYFVYPLLNKRGRTPTQSVMKIERVEKGTYKILPRPRRCLSGLYMSILTLPCLLFVPVPTVSINYVFSITGMFGISMVGLIGVIASMLMVIFDKFNRGLTELLTFSIALKEEMLDEVYKVKGYYV